MIKIFIRIIVSALLFTITQSVTAQQPGLLISALLANPNGTDENLEFLELTATKTINFATTNYTVIFNDGSNATAANGWKTGSNGSYAIEINTGSIAAGEKIFVGGNAFIINGTTCKKIQKNTATTTGDGGIGSFGNGGILGNGGGNADGIGVFDLSAASITNTSIPIDAIFFGTAPGSASGKFTVPTNDHYNNAQGKFGVGTNTFVAPDPGSDQYIIATGEFNPSTFTFTTVRTWTTTTTIPNCNAASTIIVTVPNTLTFTVNTILTSPYLFPPNISGVIGDATDPAATFGAVFSVKDNGTDIPADDYTVTSLSSNAAVVPGANITVTKANGNATVKINAAGVGYSTITLTLNKAGATKTYVINYAASAQGSNNSVSTHYHTGYSDASTAIAIDDDNMLIADDENNKLFVYNRKNSGLPLKTFDYNTLLNLTDLNGGIPREVDLEGSARGVANTSRIFWIGSMSNKSSDAPFSSRPNRNRIFATDISGTAAATTFNYIGDYENLRSNIITWGDANGLALSASAADGKDPKLVDGFNAEGLCFAPNNTTLYIGFRAPLLPVSNRTRALIVPILNFETWFGNGSPAASPTFGTPILLDLKGFGIRSIDKLSNNTYVIVAGNYDDGPFNGAIYTWNGNPADAPVIQPSFNIAGMNPEGFLQMNSGGNLLANQLQLISDNGAFVYYNDAIAAKDLATSNFKKFRSDIVTSPGNVLPIVFAVFDLRIQNKNNVLLQWTSGNIGEAASFEVQRAQTGNTYSTIATITSSQAVANYYFEDKSLANGTYEYRIKVINKNGQYFYSAVKLARVTDVTMYVSVYPNPFVNSITLFSQDISEKQVRILNAAGSVVYKTAFTGTSIVLQLGALPKGISVLEVRGKEFRERIKLVK